MDNKAEEYVIYLTSKTDPNRISNIILHLAGENGNEKFRGKLETRRECKDGKIPWYSLWWPRESRIFEGEKIVFPYKSPVSRFAYVKSPFYGARDMYFITYKEGEFSHERMSLKYLLGIINSSLGTFWFENRSNIKDGKRELFGKRMESFPVFQINFENEEQKIKQE